MRIGNFDLWVSRKDAIALGCTHTGWFYGIVPGYVEPEEPLWVSCSDALAPVEAILTFMWTTMRNLRGEEHDFMFELGDSLLPDDDADETQGTE